MKAKKCDRCGKYYDDYRDNGKHNCACGVNGVALVGFHHDLKYHFNDSDAMDLCKECLDKVYKFLKEVDNDEP